MIDSWWDWLVSWFSDREKGDVLYRIGSPALAGPSDCEGVRVVVLEYRWGGRSWVFAREHRVSPEDAKALFELNLLRGL